MPQAAAPASAELAGKGKMPAPVARAQDPATKKAEAKAAAETIEPPYDLAPPEPPPVEPPSEYAPPKKAQAKIAAHVPTVEATKQDVKSADEGEFMHLSATKVTGATLIGKIATCLRKKAGSVNAARARDLLSRGVKVKEREEHIAFITPDECFLMLSDKDITDELNAALGACGIKKRAHVERTDESLLADDIERAKSLFGKDGVV